MDDYKKQLAQYLRISEDEIADYHIVNGQCNVLLQSKVEFININITITNDIIEE